MSRTLYVAAGGGGDALAAALLAHSYNPSDPCPTIATFSWDRLLIDPLPGPRSASDFVGLESLDGLSCVVTASTRTLPPAGSTLPHLAANLSTGALRATIVLLDPTEGVVGLRAQLRSHLRATSSDAVVVVDVGGDILALGHEPGLRSPLGDALALAATDRLGVPVQVWIAGPGTDGELKPAEVQERLRDLASDRLSTIPRDLVQPILEVLQWHPSEATALLIAAVQGIRGKVDIRSGGMPVVLDDDSSAVVQVDGELAFHQAPLALAIRNSRRLQSAQASVEAKCGRSEIQYEALKARTFKPTKRDVDWRLIGEYAVASRQVGISYATFRRLNELVGVDDFRSVREGLTERWLGSYEPPLVRLSAIASNTG